MYQKNFSIKILALFLLFCINENSYGQVVQGISFTTHLYPGTTQYIPICGNEQRLDNIKVPFYYTNLQALCNIGNPYKAIVTLYKNNVVYDVHEFNLSSNYFNETFSNVPVSSGSTFKAKVQFQRKKNFCIGYQTVCDVTSSNLETPVQNGAPNFNVNGVNVPTNGAAINACISNIKLNASSTSCETSYNINVQECDQWWGRTYDYEFGLWFNGQAPDNINLQSIASTYSYPPHYTGNPARQGSILIGGNLPNGNARYYRVSICTGPTWTCKTALIKVINTCRSNKDDLANSDNLNNEVIEVIEDNDSIIKTENTKANLFVIEDDLIKLFPNPNNGVFKLLIENNEEDVNVEIYNSIGLVVNNINFKGIENQIDISNYPKGIYTLKINVNNKNIIKKIIKE